MSLLFYVIEIVAGRTLRGIVLTHVADPTREFGESLAIGAFTDPVHGQMRWHREARTGEERDRRLEIEVRHGVKCEERRTSAPDKARRATRARQPTHGAPRPRGSSYEIEPRRRVCPLALDARERGDCFGGKRRERRIVLDLFEGALARGRHLHSRIQNAGWVEAVLHQGETRECLL